MSGREEVSTEYKAGRKRGPTCCAEQWPHCTRWSRRSATANVKVDGFEADDVIATLARQAREKGIDVMVVTGDRDMFQIVGDGVRVMATSRGITETKIYDRQAVIDRYGIPPELIPDFYGLKGDTSDNIPGVPGIGDKTASDLLQRFGDLETRPRLDRRDLRRQAQGEPDQPRRRRAHVEGAGDDPARRRRSTIDLGGVATRRARPVGDPRDLPRCSSCATRCAGSRRRSASDEAACAARRPRPTVEARAREGRAGRPVAARRRARRARGRAPAAGRAGPGRAASGRAPRPLRFARLRGRRRGAGRRGGDARGGDDGLGRAAARRPRLEVDRRAEEPCPAPPLEHDTLVAAYCSTRRGARYPLEELLENEGIGVAVKGADGLAAGRGRHARARRAPARAPRGAGPDAAAARGRAAAGGRADRDGARRA